MAEVGEISELDLKAVVIPAERTVKSKFDITLKDDDFLFDGGHTEAVAKIGVLDPNNLYKVEGNGGIWSVVTLDTVPTSAAYLSDKEGVLTKLVQYFGEQLGQSGLGGFARERENIAGMQKKLEDPNLPEKNRVIAEEYVKKNTVRIEAGQIQQEHQAHAARTFLDRIAQTGVDVTQIKKYEDTNKLINDSMGLQTDE